ncbi:hypothetical protein CLBKND_03267 [Methylorubrum aminovorans]
MTAVDGSFGFVHDGKRRQLGVSNQLRKTMLTTRHLHY